jgi:BirA family biotin operon repressor/biotin-[acetyl-CoA-carboxylase] ligase
MFTIHYYDTVTSTMDIARENLSHGTVIQGGEQTGGRGRRGNAWASPKGNLYQSIVLKPDMPVDTWGQLSFVIAVALGECLQGKTYYHLKWPNDVLINDQKLAGVLIEVQGDHVIIGTGVNIQHAPEDRAKVTDFHDISVNDFRDQFLSNIQHYYDQWQLKGFEPIRTTWITHAYKLGEIIQARLPNVIYEGVFEGLDENGVLLLRESDGSIRHINSGEILVS